MTENDSKKLCARLAELRKTGVKMAEFDESQRLMRVEFFDPKVIADLQTARMMEMAMATAPQAIDELSALRNAVINAKTPQEREHLQNQLNKAESESIVYQSS